MDEEEDDGDHDPEDGERDEDAADGFRESGQLSVLSSQFSVLSCYTPSPLAERRDSEH
jgi:hypothetical protein